MTGEINEPKITLAKEMSQVLADGEFPIGARIKRMAFGPVTTRFGIAPSVLMPTLATEVQQARRDWPSYQPASEAVFTMPRATPSILKKRRLGQPISALMPEPTGVWAWLRKNKGYFAIGGLVLFMGVLIVRGM